MVDSNNNSSVGKYSLRPRSESKKSAEECCGGEDDVVVTTSLLACVPRTRKTSRQRSQPLSKYRRRSANARERSRMREINEAFETLRSLVSRSSEKTTKISTLHLAMGYITALSEALRSPAAETGDGRQGEVTEESAWDDQTSARHSTPTLVFENVSRMRLTYSSNRGPSVDQSNVLKMNKMIVKSSKVSERESFNKRTNSKGSLPSSTDEFLQEVSLVSNDGFLSDKVSSLPRNLDICEHLTEPVDSLAISQVSSFCSVKTLATSSVSDFCKASDRLSSETIIGFKSTVVGDGSVLDEAQPEYEDSTFLPVDEELGSLPMSHISFEELFNS